MCLPIDVAGVAPFPSLAPASCEAFQPLDGQAPTMDGMLGREDQPPPALDAGRAVHLARAVLAAREQ